MSSVTSNHNIFGMKGVIELVPNRHVDNRGYFTETYRRSSYIDLGIYSEFIQDNMAFSHDVGTIRGLHFQTPPAAQAKLVSLLRGEVLDVFVDIRKGSPTYGNWASIVLSADKGNQLYLPEGFAHGYITLQEDCLISYKVSAYYAPECESGIRWDDPQLNIDWQNANLSLALSDKDKVLPTFSELNSPFVYDE